MKITDAKTILLTGPISEDKYIVPKNVEEAPRSWKYIPITNILVSAKPMRGISARK